MARPGDYLSSILQAPAADIANAYIKPPNPIHTDVLLTELVSIVNTSDVEIPITLTIGAGFIYGRLAGVMKYLRHVAAVSVNGAALNDIPVFAESLEGQAKRYASYEGSNDKDRDSSYIHLAGARAFSQGIDIALGSGGWWRGRLVEVHGFNLGLLSELNNSVAAPIGFLRSSDPTS